MKKISIYFFYLVFLTIPFVACTEDPVLDDENSVEHEFSLTEVNTYRFEVDTNVVQGGLRVLNSLNNSLYVSVDMYTGHGVILPKQKGNFISGHDFGPANGTEGNNAYLNVHLTYKNEKYYAYSAHAYGYREQDLVPDSECRISIVEYEGDYKQVELWGLSGWGGPYTLFMGTIKVLFEGTFKTKDGSKSIEVSKGEMYIFNVPNGTTVRYIEE